MNDPLGAFGCCNDGCRPNGDGSGASSICCWANWFIWSRCWSSGDGNWLPNNGRLTGPINSGVWNGLKAGCLAKPSLSLLVLLKSRARSLPFREFFNCWRWLKNGSFANRLLDWLPANWEPNRPPLLVGNRLLLMEDVEPPNGNRLGSWNWPPCSRIWLAPSPKEDDPVPSPALALKGDRLLLCWKFPPKPRPFWLNPKLDDPNWGLDDNPNWDPFRSLFCKPSDPCINCCWSANGKFGCCCCCCCPNWFWKLKKGFCWNPINGLFWRPANWFCCNRLNANGLFCAKPNWFCIMNGFWTKFWLNPNPNCCCCCCCWDPGINWFCKLTELNWLPCPDKTPPFRLKFGFSDWNPFCGNNPLCCCCVANPAFCEDGNPFIRKLLACCCCCWNGLLLVLNDENPLLLFDWNGEANGDDWNRFKPNGLLLPLIGKRLAWLNDKLLVLLNRFWLGGPPSCSSSVSADWLKQSTNRNPVIHTVNQLAIH